MVLEGRVALVTGGSRGIGRATALRLSRLGAGVAVNFKSGSAEAEQVRQEIATAGGSALTVQADVADRVALSRMVDRVSSELGPIDILINNAGFVCDRLLLRMTDDEWTEVWDADYGGAAVLARMLLAAMCERGWGRVINVASVVGIAGNAGQANYAAAKGALIGLTSDLALSVAGSGVTVNCVAPGYIHTDATASLESQYQEAWLQQVPLGRYGDADEVARLIAFLAGPDTGYITGECLVVDGGLMAGRR